MPYSADILVMIVESFVKGINGKLLIAKCYTQLELFCAYYSSFQITTHMLLKSPYVNMRLLIAINQLHQERIIKL